MSISASASFATTVEGHAMQVAARLSITLPNVTQTDYTFNLRSISFDSMDTTSYPEELTDRAGVEDTAGTVVLGGSASLVKLFDPDDPSSLTYRQDVKGSPFTFDFGVAPWGQPAELLRRITGSVQSFTVDVFTGTVTVSFADSSADWDDLPAMPAVLLDSPYNADLTSEFVLDRYCRALSGGAVSTWPALRSQCALAVGMRTSIWPEVGSLLTDKGQPLPTFASGAFGRALFNSTTTGGGYADPTYQLASALDDYCFIEFWATGLANSGANAQVNVTDGTSVGINLFANSSQVTVTVTTGVGADVATDPAVSLDNGPHYIAAAVHVPVGSTSVTGTVYVDGVAYPFTATAPTARPSSPIDQANVIVRSGATIEAVQVTTESAPSSNGGFAPLAKIDPALNTLQAVPAVTEGTKGWDEIQNLTEAEGGFACRTTDAGFLFLNRNTITSQASLRTVGALSSLKGLTTSVGAVSQYDAVQASYTEWTPQPAATVFSPVARWCIPAHSFGANAVTWTRTLPNGITAAEVAGTCTVLPDGSVKADGTLSVDKSQNWYRASLDKYGNGEHPSSTLAVTVVEITPSQIKVTAENRGARDAWLVTPSNYTDASVGTPALWIGGIPIVADDPTTVTYGSGAKTLPMPDNAYRQDRDSTLAFLQSVLRQVQFPLPSDTVDIVPDARITVPDKITLEKPTADGTLVSIDVLVWGVSFSADFESATWDMSLDVRRLSPPGAWKLGVSKLGVDNYLYGWKTE